MNCAEVDSGEYIERYVLGELRDAEAQKLEEHYLECTRCFDGLNDVLALRAELADERRVMPARPARARRQQRWIWMVTAAVLVVGVGLTLMWSERKESPDTSAQIAELAAIRAPPYEPRNLRSPGGESMRLFREAMTRYQQGDYAGAIPGLDAAVRLDPSSAQSSFYAGACYLLTDQPTPAIESLTRVVELGETPYFERALLYRAKAFLGAGSLEPARRELEEVVQIQGELEAVARQILDQLPR